MNVVLVVVLLAGLAAAAYAFGMCGAVVYGVVQVALYQRFTREARA